MAARTCAVLPTATKDQEVKRKTTVAPSRPPTNTSGTAMSTCGTAGWARCRPGVRSKAAVTSHGMEPQSNPPRGAPAWPLKTLPRWAQRAPFPHLREGLARKGGHLVEIGGEEQEGGQARRPDGVSLHGGGWFEESQHGFGQGGAGAVSNSGPMGLHTLCKRSGTRLGGGLGGVAHCVEDIGHIPARRYPGQAGEGC